MRLTIVLLSLLLLTACGGGGGVGSLSPSVPNGNSANDNPIIPPWETLGIPAVVWDQFNIVVNTHEFRFVQANILDALAGESDFSYDRPAILPIESFTSSIVYLRDVQPITDLYDWTGVIEVELPTEIKDLMGARPLLDLTLADPYSSTIRDSRGLPREYFEYFLWSTDPPGQLQVSRAPYYMLDFDPFGVCIDFRAPLEFNEDGVATRIIEFRYYSDTEDA